jgi:DNA (cytosine-5)-methyltransferase 1
MPRKGTTKKGKSTEQCQKGTKARIKVIDLFCGIGGLTHGFIKEGLEVVAGIDNDRTCKYGYEYNNKAKFIHKDILEVTADDVRELFGNDESAVRVLAGCAPCQPFSRLNTKGVTEQQRQPLEKFARLIEETLPDIVSMENVGGLADMKKYPIFKDFVSTLDRNEYRYRYEIIDASDYGVPQHRKRLVLLASRLGEISLVPKTHLNNKATVRDVIFELPAIKDGDVHPNDPLHRASKLSPINLERVKATPHDGGSSRSWSRRLQLPCHERESGTTYKCTVYGRMRWDDLAPTMTTQCVGLGNGRFGHPEQDRAISLREAALLQTFPRKYRFVEPRTPVYMAYVSKFIGNAVPVRLGRIIGRSIKRHVSAYAK